MMKQARSDLEAALASRPAWVEINIGAFIHNLRVLRQAVAPGVKIIAVLKADAYGHGAVPLAQMAVREGVEVIAVAIAAEAVPLREAGIKCPLLVLGYTPQASLDLVVTHDLSQCIFSLQAAEALSRVAVRLGKTARVHLKVDTGMGRLGFTGDQGRRDMLAVARLPGLEIEGIFSHFATADATEKTFAYRQLDRFLATVEWLRRQGLTVPLRHMANSGALLDLPAAHLDAVRPGIALYGYYPSAAVAAGKVALQPVMTLKARIVQVKAVAAETPVSYGCIYRCSQSTRVATVPLGYADGVPRVLSGRIAGQVRGQTFPQAGRICMDQMMFDLGEVPLNEGDEIVLFGRWWAAGRWWEASVETWAALADTIPYEILTGISPRLPRFYLAPP
ncbi:MAG: alanine racemase [Heliobacteriaceae bacterium]|nr:alanine racemase [Heliobacteriaceae bacterium]MDD4588181.1 alanine racemase [Heliobacteriaceae bacterium]